jgi:glutamine amidotransferase
MIALPNLSAGNFASVLRMVERAEGTARLVDDPAELTRADKIIVAGVGAFENGMRSLREGGWVEPLLEARQRGTPIFGICLGMQLLCASSEEGTSPGLGWIDAIVKRFVPPAGTSIKVPHMGWNTVDVVRENNLLPDGRERQRFYFVHSYYVSCADERDVIATSHHGEPFVAAFSRENVFGVQFHPEKSHRFGLALMKRFVEL